VTHLPITLTSGRAPFSQRHLPSAATRGQKPLVWTLAPQPTVSPTGAMRANRRRYDTGCDARGCGRKRSVGPRRSWLTLVAGAREKVQANVRPALHRRPKRPTDPGASRQAGRPTDDTAADMTVIRTVIAPNGTAIVRAKPSTHEARPDVGTRLGQLLGAREEHRASLPRSQRSDVWDRRIVRHFVGGADARIAIPNSVLLDRPVT
jgi:hypothetical protein